MSEQTSLYRHFAADGSLLYVGISLSWPARTRTHAHYSSWFALVAKVEIEQFPTREAALTAERDAIRCERPRFNVVHNRGTVAPRAQHKPRRLIQRGAQSEFLIGNVRGPHAIFGPALIYHGETISVLVAHGSFGTQGELTELILGERFPDIPEWADACASVLTIRRSNEITITEARQTRREIIDTLRANLDEVQAFDTDLAFATAYATQFPSAKSRQVLDRVASEVVK